MGTLTSFFGGSGGGAAAIPNITYDSIRKATYKSKFQITGNENPVLIPQYLCLDHAGRSGKLAAEGQVIN